MLQRAASNAYSWWWASHIRTKQSKWLDSNLQEMEETVKKMLKLIEPDADSFARRAELYFKRRPELITFVEDVYRAYRALAERYDHISGELHKANHTIATACPDQVQYAMLGEEDDSFPKAITPIDPGKINKPIVEGLMRRKRKSGSSSKKEEKESSAPLMNKKEAEEEISKLQKEILVLQTEKEYIKSSYESGIAKYWEIEKQVMEKQEKVYYLQDEFSTSAVIEDNEARSLMTTAALKSCEDAIVNLQEQRKKSLEQAKVESERVKIANEKLKILKGEHSGMGNPEVSGENKQMTFTVEKMAEDADSLKKVRLEIQSICEKVKTHFDMNPQTYVIEVAEKINELVNKVITLEITVSSQAVQINRLTSDNNELDKSLLRLEEEKTILINDSNELTKKLKEAEEELSGVQAVEKLVQDEEIAFQENFSEACQSINDISEKLRSYQPPENDLPADAFAEADASTLKVESQNIAQVKEVTEIRDGKKGFEKEIYTTRVCMDDPSITGVGSEPRSASEDIEDSKKVTEVGKTCSPQTVLEGEENILLAEDKSILQNYEETKQRLSETEKKNEEYLEGTMAMITELKNAIAMKDEEIELLRQKLAFRTTSYSGTVDEPFVEDTRDGHQKPGSTSNSLIVTGNSELQDSHKPEDLNASTTERKSFIEFPELQSFPEEGTNLDSLNKPRSISPIEEKFRRDIDNLLDGNLEFWLRFSTSFHQILEFKSKYNDLQAEISKVRDNKAADSNDNATGDQAEVPESASILQRLRELKTELQVWLEQCELLRAELQSRISNLRELQEEISSAINTKSESAETMFTPFQAAKLHGEVMSMKQENIKAADELQAGIDQVRRLQPDIEKQLPKLYVNFKPSPSESTHPSPSSENYSGTTRIPLRVFLFGAKPKKRSFFERIQPVLQKQNIKLRASRWSKRNTRPNKE